MKKTAIILIIALVLALATFALSLTGCDNDNNTDTHTHEWEWVETTPATPTADGLETETCKTCGATNGTRPIAHPSPIEFTVTFNFATPGDPVLTRNATIRDQRTTCGSQNLEQLGIVTIIEEAIQGSFDEKANNTPLRNRFRNVFGADEGVTIIVNNPATPYKLKATDKITIYFHFNYLQNESDDIQQIIFDTIAAMNTGGTSLPYNAE
jgi:hypothetical protein